MVEIKKLRSLTSLRIGHIGTRPFVFSLDTTTDVGFDFHLVAGIEQAFCGGDHGFRELTVGRTVQYLHHVFSFRLTLPHRVSQGEFVLVSSRQVACVRGKGEI